MVSMRHHAEAAAWLNARQHCLRVIFLFTRKAFFVDPNEAAPVRAGQGFYGPVARTRLYLAHPQSATKFSYTRRPSAPLFSGWNWVPITLTRAAAAAGECSHDAIVCRDESGAYECTK